VGRACSTNGKKRNAHRILVEKPDGRLGRPRHRLVDNIKMDLKTDRMGWIEFTWLRKGSSGGLL
jgi:hypothetical protein